MEWLGFAIITLMSLAAIVAGWHTLLFKRDPRASLGWLAVCVLYPFVGPFLYFLFGINRVRTRAQKLEAKTPFQVQDGERREGTSPEPLRGSMADGLLQIARISDNVTRRPLVGANRAEMLQDGEQAFPSMLDAVRGARNHLYLSSYIFETNRTGRDFIAALSDASMRGVDVKVLLDGIGEFYSFPRAGTLLKKKGIRFARFLPPRLLPPAVHINLRNHRKIMTADGECAFVGGMNIGDRHLAGNLENPSRVRDAHFRLQGPIVNQIEEIFLEDWAFATGEVLSPGRTVSTAAGTAVCRAVSDGPNDDLDKLSTILVGAISLARERVYIVTPYFLPSRDMIAALQIAALKGARVAVVLPGKNNLPFVHWATRNMLWELLQKGVRVYYQPPPFVHTKLFLVDDMYVQVGSANIDPRSLRLNFELVVEIFDQEFARGIRGDVEKAIARSREVTLEEIDDRPLHARTRDALAWLFTPYL